MADNQSEGLDTLTRSTTACNRCRRRKQKCHGGVPCRNCALSKASCIYETGKKVSISETKLQWLEARSKAYESRLAQWESSEAQRLRAEEAVETDTLSSSPLSSNAQPGPDDISGHVLDGIGQIVLTPSGRHHYLGNSSSDPWAVRFRNFVQGFKSENDDNDLEVESLTYKYSEWPTRRPSHSNLPRLPPYDIAKRLYQKQHMYIGTIFSFVEPQVFEQRLQKMYRNDADLSDRDTCLSYCQVLLVLAYGMLYQINQWHSDEGPPGFSYFIQALEILPDIHEEGSLLFVEVLSLVGYFMQVLNRRDAAFLYIGLALRMAISLGLHQEISDSMLDDVSREHRRRLWWSVYSMDRILCAKSGNPIMIADEDIGVRPPSRLDEAESLTSPPMVLLHYTELSRILGRISKLIYSRNDRTRVSLESSVQSVMADLSRWLQQLPDALRFNFAQPDKPISRESVSIFLHYHQCINMTARPLLFHVVQKRLEARRAGADSGSDWREGLSQNKTVVIEACITAARNSATMMGAAAKQNLVATYGFMDGEHAFSAAIVLLMVNIAFPFNPPDYVAMQTAMNVLFEMGEKGNAHMKAHHKMLLALQSSAAATSMSDSSPAPTRSQPVAANPVPDIPAAVFTEPPIYQLQYTDALDQNFSAENAAGDGIPWEEEYGNTVGGMDLDWEFWIQAARGAGDNFQ